MEVTVVRNVSANEKSRLNWRHINEYMYYHIMYLCRHCK